MKLFTTAIIVAIFAFADAKRLNKGAAAKKAKHVKKAEPVAAETAALAETALLQKATAPGFEKQLRNAAEEASEEEAEYEEARDTPSTDEEAEWELPPNQAKAQMGTHLVADEMSNKVRKTRELAGKRVENAKAGVFKVIINIATQANQSKPIMDALGLELVKGLVAFAGESKAVKDSNPELMCSMAKQVIKWARSKPFENDGKENECNNHPAEALCKTRGCEWTDGSCHALNVAKALDGFLAEVKKADWELMVAKVRSAAEEKTATPKAFAEQAWEQGSNWAKKELEKPEWQKVKSTVQEKTAGPKAFAEHAWKQGSNWVKKCSGGICTWVEEKVGKSQKQQGLNAYKATPA